MELGTISGWREFVVVFKIEWNKDGIRAKFDVFIPNSRKLSLILAELVHELGTRTHWGTLHAFVTFGFQRHQFQMTIPGESK